ncbi:NAD(P)/FAD-dependent oxidoreductase [Cyanobium sp. Morenito 9A2]|uniref:NAD(P)/FAD-dependent oxidoreductase n=1 Tax=Cyanobium sp. Morenito 9A2 TaxID=2823718 RepID=UPI0020CDBE32|nr:NAD(P)/FAD-dependent oxidoreductase [Cyanobium sp. Morenito 9A2]MCP9850805.1 NAD(P)/FAD-dependent oxidoreductase [Cyanobium sp. Morenito 9A2]
MAPERFFLELEPPAPDLAAAPHVVVVGGGFAGLRLCQALAGQRVRVTLIDKRNFNLFQPLLYQVASGLVSAADVASPLRQMVGQARNVQVLLGEVNDLDLERREVVFNGQHYGYDRLVLASGSGTAYFGHEEWRPLAPPMKILEHAQEIRRRLLMALEEAEQTTDLVRRRFLQSVVVVGGGPAGCELAGSLVELMRSAIQRDFKQLKEQDCRVVLVDAVERVLPAMHPSLSAAAAGYLRANGVEVRLNTLVEAIEPGTVRLKPSTAAAGAAPQEEGVDPAEQLRAATICWTAGVRASRLGKLLAERSGCATDRGGRVLVEPDFSIPGHPEVRVLGDLCCYRHTADGAPLPGMAGPAVQMGAWVARDLLNDLAGRPTAPFRWNDLGTMAVIGPLYAVADLRGLRLTGLAGWLLWGLAHLAFIPDTENRITLLSRWLWQIATRQRRALLITGRPDQHLGVDVGLERARSSGTLYAEG